MRKYEYIKSGFLLTCFIMLSSTVFAKANDNSILTEIFNLAAERSQDVQYYIMQSEFMTYAPNGDRLDKDVYRMNIKCIPAKLTGKVGDEYTCTAFKLKLGNLPEITIPALQGWTYLFNMASDGLDEKGQVFGIEHSKFENLLDSSGKPLSPDKAYLVYNTFIDFHAFFLFVEKTSSGNGIQDLKKIGQKIVHVAAYTEAPVNLGSNIADGSFFKNGKVTLFFKGLSLVNEMKCAILAYDSGESSFQMTMNPAPDMELHTVGSSHYKGDIYLDLYSYWIQEANMDEIVVSETNLPFPPDKVNTVTERHTILRNVGEKEYEQDY